MSNITQFVSHVKQKGIASLNRYRITFGLPPELVNYIVSEPTSTFDNGIVENSDYVVQKPNTVSETSPSISLMCQGATLPGYNISSTEVKNSTRVRKTPHAKTYGDFDVTFISSGDMNEKKLFDAWQGLMVADNTEIEFYDNLVADIQVEVLDRADRVVYMAKMIEAYPSVVTPISLDRTAQNAFQTFQVTFNYWNLINNEDVYQLTKQNPADFFNPIIPSGEQSIFRMPGFREVLTIRTAVDIYKQIESVKRAIENGLTAKEAGRMLRQISEQIKNVSGLPHDEAMKLINHVNDVIFAIGR